MKQRAMGQVACTQKILTSAESEILDLVRSGLTNAGIAQMRRTSARTVINQVANIFRKFGVASRRELKALLVKGPQTRSCPCAPTPVTRRPTLTPRERQVLELASMGESNKLIADQLGITVSTAGVLLSRAKRKLVDEPEAG
jgi:DNA-binding CsgD family transcriptional regulator